MSIKIDKAKLKDTRGRPLTQSLFLEHQYNTDYAVYTLKDEDYEYEGKVYPSLKRLYLEEEDVVEYGFSTKYLLGWDHWQRICANAAFSKVVESWRFELQLKMRSDAVKNICDIALSGANFQASKWLAEGGWDKQGAGRPSKKKQEREQALRDSIAEDYADDIARAVEVRTH